MAESGLGCSMQDLLLRRTGLSPVVALGLLSSCGVQVFSSCGARAPERVGSVFVVLRLSCPKVCGISVPQPGIEPASPALEGRFLTTGPPGKSQEEHFYRREKEIGGNRKQTGHGFLLAESLTGKKRNLFCLLGSAIFAGCESSNFW